MRLTAGVVPIRTASPRQEVQSLANPSRFSPYLMSSQPTGTGTYDDPISFATATDNNNLPRCAIVYVPLLQKYFRNEDDCAECGTLDPTFTSLEACL